MHTCTGTHTCELCVGWLLATIHRATSEVHTETHTHTHTHSYRHAHTCFQGSNQGLAFSAPSSEWQTNNSSSFSLHETPTHLFPPCVFPSSPPSPHFFSPQSSQHSVYTPSIPASRGHHGPTKALPLKVLQLCYTHLHKSFPSCWCRAAGKVLAFKSLKPSAPILVLLLISCLTLGAFLRLGFELLFPDLYNRIVTGF